MARRKDIPDDSIQKLIEWEEHQYNSGYWINRFTPFFPPKRTRGNWILSLIDVFMFIPAFIVVFIRYINTNEQWLRLPVLMLGIFGIAALLRSRNLKPIDDREEENEEANSQSVSNRRRKKKQPKRRKDYR